MQRGEEIIEGGQKAAGRVTNDRLCPSSFQAMKLDLDYKDEKISSLTKELEDLNTSGATDEEIAAVKRQKHELELRLKDQVGTVESLLLNTNYFVTKKTILISLPFIRSKINFILNCNSLEGIITL